VSQDRHSTLKQALDKYLSNSELKTGIDSMNIRGAWNQVMGKSIDKYTSQIDFRKGTLFVAISSAPLRQELFMGRDKIRENLNAFLGSDLIKDVRLR